MKIWKNLFGKNDKIHVDEIVVGDKDNHDLLSDVLDRFKMDAFGSYNGQITYTLKDSSFYILLTNVGSNNSNGFGIYAIHTYGSGYQYLYQINNNSYVDVELEGRTLTLNRSGNYGYALIEINRQ